MPQEQPGVYCTLTQLGLGAAASFTAFRFSAKEHIYIARKIKIAGKDYESPVRSRTVAQYCCF